MMLLYKVEVTVEDYISHNAPRTLYFVFRCLLLASAVAALHSSIALPLFFPFLLWSHSCFLSHTQFFLPLFFTSSPLSSSQPFLFFSFDGCVIPSLNTLYLLSSVSISFSSSASVSCSVHLSLILPCLFFPACVSLLPSCITLPLFIFSSSGLPRSFSFFNLGVFFFFSLLPSLPLFFLKHQLVVYPDRPPLFSALFWSALILFLSFFLILFFFHPSISPYASISLSLSLFP